MKTANEHRADAERHFQNAEDSFQRCDTDGFLSQWASDINGRLSSTRAQIAENGGLAAITVLVDSDGELVPAKRIPTQYGDA